METLYVVSLSRSLQPLKDRFNANRDRLRFLAVVSPTSPECVQGARAVRLLLVGDFPRADVSVSVVWINMLAPDSADAATLSAKIIQDPRVRHFHDPERRAGKAIAESLGGQDKVAWDMYLFYTSGSPWSDMPPTPTDWVHQLPGMTWADPARCHCGNDLVRELRRVMSELTGPPGKASLLA